jgi:hypothetical protein
LDFTPSSFTLIQFCFREYRSAKGRVFIQIDNEHVDLAVIVEIPKGASPAPVRLRNPLASSL